MNNEENNESRDVLSNPHGVDTVKNHDDMDVVHHNPREVVENVVMNNEGNAGQQRGAGNGPLRRTGRNVYWPQSLVLWRRLWNYRFLFRHILRSLINGFGFGFGMVSFSRSRSRWRLRLRFGLYLFGLLHCHVSFYELDFTKERRKEILTDFGNLKSDIEGEERYIGAMVGILWLGEGDC
ncbi:uncharacterized protein G2W53_027295 [Senna tora]|uniref:Transmembrane protein n=1 Tax=Senna tora TaxID=362788 RepID=A0A834WFY0_9FABA|nr:uncharacterized protein G2W53_027295 [Senna tora]